MCDDKTDNVVPYGSACTLGRKIPIGELAGRNGLTPYYIRKWAAQGLIPHYRVGNGNLLFPEREAMVVVAQLLAKNRTNRGAKLPPSMN
jgi:hypothetical protein